MMGKKTNIKDECTGKNGTISREWIERRKV